MAPQMTRYLNRIRSFLLDESGPTAVEYAIMLAMIIIMCIGTILSTGNIQKVIWEDSRDAMHDALSSK
jgi:pilus assembly protein Flp/PilA